MATTSDLVIGVNDIRKTYVDGIFRRRRVEALKGVSLQIGKGEVFGLLGPNGAGKTTLIKVLLGIVRKSGGQASLLGRPIGERHSRSRVGFLPESHRFPQHHTGLTALEHFGGLSGMSIREIRQKTPGLLELVGLGEWGKTPVKKYSKGMQQRLGLAQAMIHDPDLLILDEPTDGVDPVGRKDMRDIIQRLKNDGKTIFINSHLLQEVELVCDRVAILDKGRVRRQGSVAELTSVPDAECTFKLLATEQAAREALAGHSIARAIVQSSDLVVVTIADADQAAVDQCIDDLRRAEISIASIFKAQRTLEDAFMEIVSNSSTADDIEEAEEVKIVE
jgi:ABC-2 type transport system ATP-binding protein